MSGEDGSTRLEAYAEMMTVAEVAEFLRLSPASVRKYAKELGGVEVIPGKLRFSRRMLEEKVHAQLGTEERRTQVAWNGNGQRRETPPVVPGRQSHIKTYGNSLGAGGKEEDATDTEQCQPDPFNLLGARVGH